MDLVKLNGFFDVNASSTKKMTAAEIPLSASPLCWFFKACSFRNSTLTACLTQDTEREWSVVKWVRRTNGTQTRWAWPRLIKGLESHGLGDENAK